MPCMDKTGTMMGAGPTKEMSFVQSDLKSAVEMAALEQFHCLKLIVNFKKVGTSLGNTQANPAAG